jgi:hypothetical protein
MTLEELTEQVKQLTLDEQLALLEVLSRTIRVTLKDSGVDRVRGLLATNQPAPSDEAVTNAYLDYIDEKYRPSQDE